ncbi:MAG: helix-turn-helix domain-containing protein [Spirochaetales bacterium]|nr:helix-turn-helix domain-containing protein [Spirochaetales bacterium]
MEIGNILRQLRLRENHSIVSVSKEFGLSKSYISKIENNERKPNNSIIKKYAKKFSLDYNLLISTRDNISENSIKLIHKLGLKSVNDISYLNYYCDNSNSFVREKESSYSVKRQIYNIDALEWMYLRKENSIHAIVTDPPYGIKEYSMKELAKLRNGNKGGVWRIPPSLGGAKRSPLPRFSILSEGDKNAFVNFFADFAAAAFKILVPGGHIFIASNPLLSHLLYSAIERKGFEKRGEIIRLVQTLRGGDRPKNAHEEFSGISVMPRSCWEPWGLFRKPLEGRVQDNLRKWRTGGLRRISEHQPFFDVIKSAPTNRKEKVLCPHPSLKPQDFMRQIVRSALPLSEGIILDPFMGGGSTIAAAEYLGYESIGLEIDKDYFRLAEESIPKLINYKATIE